MSSRAGTTSVLVSALCLFGGYAEGRAAVLQDGRADAPAHVQRAAPCSADAVRDVLARASAAMQGARYQEAIQTLQPLAALSCDPRLNLLLAAAHEGSGDVRSATEVLQQAHDLWPTNNSVATSLARGLLATGQTAKAGRALDHFHATPETSVRELELAVVVLLANHELVTARETAKVAYEREPSLQTLLLLANALQLEGRYKDVIALLQDRRSTYGEFAAFLVTIAESEFDEKIFDAALADLTRAVALDPKLYQAHYLRGNALMNSNDVDGAMGEYREAIRLQPGQPRTYFQLALALRAKQDEAGEEGVLQQLLATDPQYAMAHSELGRILINQSRLPEAVVQLKLAIEQNPSSEQAYYLLSRAYDRLGETEKSTATAKLLASVRRANHRRGEAKDATDANTGPETTP